MSDMSLNHFDSPVILNCLSVEGVTQVADSFTATGPLDAEQQAQDFAVLVSIWQTDDDKGGSGTTAVAYALGVGLHDKDSKADTWSAPMSMRDGTRFAADRPATGVGLIVASSNDDPTSFETYSWIERVQIKFGADPVKPFAQQP